MPNCTKLQLSCMQDTFARARSHQANRRRDDRFSCIQSAFRPSSRAKVYILHLYTRYPIVARRAWPAGCIQPLGRVRRASKGILHTNLAYKTDIDCVLDAGPVLNLYARYLYSRAHLAYAAARPSARATVGYRVYKF